MDSVREQLYNLINETKSNNSISSFAELLKNFLLFKVPNHFSDSEWILYTNYRVYLIDWEQFQNLEAHNDNAECDETIGMERGITCVKKLLLNYIR